MNAKDSEGFGLLRFSLQGKWSIEEFEQLLHTIRQTYYRLNALEFFSEMIERERPNLGEEEKEWGRRSRFEPSSNTYFTSLFHEITDLRRAEDPEDAVSQLVSISNRHIGDLILKRIHLGSPGWIDIIGSWNPLKVIADAIVEWRKLNTEQDSKAREMVVELERIRSQERIEMAKIKSDVAKTIIDKGKNLRGAAGDLNGLEGILAAIDADTKRNISEFAKDSRLKSVNILAVDALEPNSPTPPPSKES